MSLSPDALLLGALALSWPNLALLLGILAFTALAARRGLEARSGWVLLAALLAARLGYALGHLGTWPDLASALLGVVDLRSGGWSWWWGLVGGAVMAGALLRREAGRLLVPAAGALALAALPLGLQQVLLRPGPASESLAFDAKPLAYLEPGHSQPIPARFGDLPKPMLLNVWATWCPPCRSEMPLLVEYQQKGYPIVLLNAGEDTEAVQGFLKEAGLSARVFLDGANLRGSFQVSGLPTTLLIGADGRVLARHLGPVNRAQLEELLERLR
ncbi:TlpA family protein disulfide reductase [Calidithermus roseus]|uniref:Thiol-disulfide oxidoreductase ResA n=1 Tax=Calidithermus roseus TaxID=1644118 RepID=A0A399EZH4_9DEIN|nr:TlpA disulfide reductase family protein [Calidithermus roseus]RIH89428.1 Thiol-disulfide oxidoreductase ResA [Calidithermus roseus]